jgi:predicted NBD/HSP70 family sugar kinase
VSPAVIASQRTVRQHNRALVLAAVADAPRRSRAQLALATGLTRATISALVDDLLDAGLLAELSPDRGLRGRPGSPLVLNGNGPAGLGVEINVDYISACVLDLTGAVRGSRTEVVDNRRGTPAVGLRRAIALARQVRAQAEADGLAVVAASVGVAGLVDADGVLRRAPNLPRWRAVDLAGTFSDALELAVSVDNEANLAALAQLWFGPASLRDFALVSGEIGVGAGVVLDGRLYRGVRGHAGELGHVVVDPDGPPSGCGANGCLEQFAGQEALLRNAGIAGGDELIRRARAGDERALTALSDAGRALGIAIAGLINVMDLPAVLLGGLYARLGQWLIEPIRAELGRRVASREWAPVEVRVAHLGSDAAVRGAAGTVIKAVIAAG